MRNTKTSVYCIAEIIREKPLEFDKFKIGIAGDPTKRLAALQTGNPRRLALIIVDWCRTRGDAIFVEQRAHDYIKGHACVGEWFSFKEGDGGCPFEALAMATAALKYIPSSDLYYDHEPPSWDGHLLDTPIHYKGLDTRTGRAGWLQ